MLDTKQPVVRSLQVLHYLIHALVIVRDSMPQIVEQYGHLVAGLVSMNPEERKNVSG